MTTARPINFQPQPINVSAAAPTTTAIPQQGLKLGINLGSSTGGKIAPYQPPAAYTPQVQIVNSAPTNLKSAAVPVAQKAAGIGARVAGASFGLGLEIAKDLLFPAPAGAGSDMIGGRPIEQVRSQISDPRDSGAFRPTTPQSQRSPQSQRQRQTDSPIGRPDPFAPIFEFEEPIGQPAAQPQQAPTPAPYRPSNRPAEKPRPALDVEVNPGTGTITLAPIDPRGKPLATPSLLDQVTEGGVNLLTPIVDFLKKLDLDIQQLKQGFQLDFSPLLEGISQLINPILEAIVAIPETFDSEIVRPIMQGIVELLTPIANLTATSIEIASTNPRTTSETVAEIVAPITVGIALIGTALDGLGQAINNISLKTITQVPTGMSVAAQIPVGMATAAQIPMGLAAAAQIPVGMATAAAIPLTMAAVAELPQTLTATADLTEIDIALSTLQKTLEKTKDDLDKCCRDISDKLKRKKREDDDRFPEFKSNGFIECDGATISYDYAGEGLKGLHQQNNIILGISKMMLKKVCDNEIEFPNIEGSGTFICDDALGSYNYSGVGLLGLQNQIDRVLDFNKKILSEICDIEVEAPSFSFPDIFGGGTYVCDGSITSYEYSGPGLIGLSSQINELTKVNTKILAEVCDGDDNEISGDISFTDCDGSTQILLYSGDGSIGLSSQITALTELTKLTYAKACETPICIPVQPGDEFAEFDVPRQLVLTWGEQYPTQNGSLWHTQIPNPREDLEWCRDFDNLIYTKGNIYGRWLWGNSKIKSGMRCESEDEADRILDLIGALSTSEGKKRFTKGGGVKLNPAIRQVRCVRAAIARLNDAGIAEVIQCFVPPPNGC